MTPKTRTIVHALCVTLTLLLIAAAVIWAGVSERQQERTAHLQYQIVDIHERQLVDTKELDRRLREAFVHPEGVTLDSVSLYRVESIIRQHPMVREAECYTTTDNEVMVRISQRKPIVRVENEGDTYYIDSERTRMPAHENIRKGCHDKLMLIRGHVSLKQAAGELTDLALWIADHDYWEQRIDYIYVRQAREICLVPTDKAQPIYVLGTTGGFADKLHKLRIYLEHSQAATQDKTYRELDLRYKGQVVARL